MASHILALIRKSNYLIDYARLPKDILSIENDATGLKEEMSRRKRTPSVSFFRWWVPEIFASMSSVASLVSLVVILRQYQGRGVHDLNLPSSLTLNGLVALLSTLMRASLMVPIGSAISQEAWLWLSNTTKRHGQLHNLEFSDAASRGAWGSLIFLICGRTR